MDREMFVNTVITWWFAAWLLPLVARMGRAWGEPPESPGLDPIQRFWPTLLPGLWLVASSSAVGLGLLGWGLVAQGILVEPFRTTAARFLGIFLVVVGLYSYEFFRGWYSSRKA